MPKRTDLKSILVIGSGPILIGQGCEFDYAGTQACTTLKKEGCFVSLINSNPATIMTDPDIADATYIETITEESIIRVIAKERPDALLATVGGQTALNYAWSLSRKGILKQYSTKLIGVTEETIEIAEDRMLFKQKMTEIGMKLPFSVMASDLDDAINKAEDLGYPIMVRCSFALGGKNSSLVKSQDELRRLYRRIYDDSLQKILNKTLCLDQGLFGWKEFELEVVRDNQDNCIVICGIENINPLGVHTGDSISVSPIMTLTDKEYQEMRSRAIEVIRALKVVGAANVQFAVNPKNGEMLIIEVNPRLSRSSALASKATGYPIAKVAALLALDYSVNEIGSDIIGGNVAAAFEPVLDYVVVKIPRFQFEKFLDAEDILSTKMQSVGESMGIGGTFQEALQKGIRSLEINRSGLERVSNDPNEILKLLSIPNSLQIYALADAFRLGMDLESVYQLTQIDPWFLYQIKELVTIEYEIATTDLKEITRERLLQLKRKGFSNQRVATLCNSDLYIIQNICGHFKINTAFKRIDSSAAEYSVTSNYMYSCHEDECECNPSKNKKYIVIGGGPNHIGQGIEFDYACVQALKSLQKLGFETIIINNNPATVSTDYNIADRLYCSPLDEEELLSIFQKENPDGIFLQFGGQTALNLVNKFNHSRFKMLGLTTALVEQTENRYQFSLFLQKIGLSFPKNVYLGSKEDKVAHDLLESIKLPLLIRPSYIIGGSRIKFIDKRDDLIDAIENLEYPILLEEYLMDAIEVEIDAICDGQDVFIPAIIEHIEPAGIHSGDSTSCIPPLRINAEIQSKLHDYTKLIALQLGIVGLLNIQFAIQTERIFVLEVNPRASRTIPYVSKYCGVNMVEASIQCILGEKLSDLKLSANAIPYFAIKKPVFSSDVFSKIILGPEMRSTGEMMSFGLSFDEASEKTDEFQIERGEQMHKSTLISLQEIHQTYIKECYA